MTAARIIEAIGACSGRSLVAVLLIRVIPHIPGVVADLRKAMRTRAFTVKVGGVELSVEDATEQLRRQVTDLQTHMAASWSSRASPPPGRPAAPGAHPAPRSGRQAAGRRPGPGDHPVGRRRPRRQRPRAGQAARRRPRGAAGPLDGRGHGRAVPAPRGPRHRHRHGPLRGRRVPLPRRPGPAPPAARRPSRTSRCSSTPARGGSSSTARTPSTPAPPPSPPRRPSCSPPSAACWPRPPTARGGRPPSRRQVRPAPAAPPDPSRLSPRRAQSTARRRNRRMPTVSDTTMVGPGPAPTPRAGCGGRRAPGLPACPR